MRKKHNEQLLQAMAELAAEWVHRLPTASPEEQERCLAWVRQSPLHVREFLIACAWDNILRDLDPKRRVDVEALIQRSNHNVVPLPRTQRARGVAGAAPTERVQPPQIGPEIHARSLSNFASQREIRRGTPMPALRAHALRRRR